LALRGKGDDGPRLSSSRTNKARRRAPGPRFNRRRLVTSGIFQLRGLQGLLQAHGTQGPDLRLQGGEALPDRQATAEPLPVLSLPEVPDDGHEAGGCAGGAPADQGEGAGGRGPGGGGGRGPRGRRELHEQLPRGHAGRAHPRGGEALRVPGREAELVRAVRQPRQQADAPRRRVGQASAPVHEPAPRGSGPSAAGRLERAPHSRLLAPLDRRRGRHRTYDGPHLAQELGPAGRGRGHLRARPLGARLQDEEHEDGQGGARLPAGHHTLQSGGAGPEGAPGGRPPTGEGLRGPGRVHAAPLPGRARALRQAPAEVAGTPVHRPQVRRASLLLPAARRRAPRRPPHRHARGPLGLVVALPAPPPPRGPDPRPT
jgi:hypothetical protein